MKPKLCHCGSNFSNIKKKKNYYILYGLYFCGVGLFIGLTNVQFVVLHG